MSPDTCSMPAKISACHILFSGEDIKMETGGEEISEETTILNVEFAGVDTRVIAWGATLQFVTYLELERLVIERLKQLNDPHSPHNVIAPQILEKHGLAVDCVSLLLAEIMDPTLDYPLRIVRGGHALRIHKDLLVLPELVNTFVLSKPDGSVSYDTFVDDMENGFFSEIERTKGELDKINTLRANMAGNVYF